MFDFCILLQLKSYSTYSTCPFVLFWLESSYIPSRPTESVVGAEAAAAAAVVVGDSKDSSPDSSDNDAHEVHTR